MTPRKLISFKNLIFDSYLESKTKVVNTLFGRLNFGLAFNFLGKGSEEAYLGVNSVEAILILVVADIYFFLFKHAHRHTTIDPCILE